ncbi:hypothetical protein V5O48_016086 [Marasmius crinis-equi]|uniref:Uncharacterized protein n=1 Tax=Marasmius crinis-equi TaxID=585013 RepID=A0ABR3ESS0_9AGAR
MTNSAHRLDLHLLHDSPSALTWSASELDISTLSITDGIGGQNPVHAVFTTVGVVAACPNNVTTVDAKYKGPSLAVQSLSEARLRLTLEGGGLPLEALRTFKRGLAGLDRLIQDCPKAPHQFKSVGILKASRRLELHHNLFQKTDLGDFPFMDRDFTDRYKRNATAGWPVLPEAEAELREIVLARTHKVSPLCVLKHGLLMSPDRWSTELSTGVVVEADFTISLRVDPAQYRNVFTANIQTLRILKERPSILY